MMWKLQENALTKSDLVKLTKYILKTKKLTQGKEVIKFENQFSKWNKSKYSIFVNSGSSANLLIVSAAKELFKWKSSAEIIVPSLTWPTTVNPVIQSGLKPIFLDTNFYDLSINYEELKKKINKNTKAIFLAHILGFPSNIKKIKEIINGRNILILEDCCESIGAKIGEKKVGNFGLGSSFSFYWGHHMTTIEGGMICTNNLKFYNLCKMKRSHGFARDLDKKYHQKIKKQYSNIDFNYLFLTDGFNLRSTNLNAFLGINQLKKLNEFIRIRNKNFKNYINCINKYKNNFNIIKYQNLKSISSFALPFIFKEQLYLKKFKKLLIENRIEFRSLITGDLTKQPYLNKYNKKNLNAEIIHKKGIYIGNNQFVNNKNFLILEKILVKTFN
jgi:CDP-4-dehydro-6-deoxyglucose reductase, E1